MHRIVVEEKTWSGERRFLQALNHWMTSPRLVALITSAAGWG